MYLFANPSTIGLYPKFGFEPVQEYEHFKAIKGYSNEQCFEQLDMQQQENRVFLYEYVKNTKAFGKLSMSENADLVMFYCTSFLQNNVYYIKELDVITVAQFHDQQIHLWDVFSKQEVGLDLILESLATPEITKVVLGFTPTDCSSYQIRDIVSDDKLFIQKGKSEPFKQQQMMFPLLSHA